MKLNSLATKDVIAVKPGDSIDKAIGLMEEHDIHHLPVIETGVVVGIVSDRDILVSVGWKLSSERKEGKAQGPIIGPRRVAEIMSKPVLTMTPQDTVQDAAIAMIEKRVGAIVIAREGHVSGIITKLDLLTHATDVAQSSAARAVFRQTVEQHMRVSVFTAAPKQPLVEVASLMHRKSLRHVPVVVERTLVGIVSERDIRRAFGGESIEDGAAESLGKLYIPPSSIMDVMSRNVRTIAPEATLLDAADMMTRHRIGCLPVTKEDQLVGIITDTDLIRIISNLDA